MMYVLDTTALFNAKDFPIDFDVVVPQGVLDELMAWGLTDRVRMLVGVRIQIHMPADKSVKRVKQAAEKTGDIDRLSPTDIEVLALAVDLDAPLISDDYSIQNTAKMLSVKCMPMDQKGIKKVFFWKYVCRGCGREYERKLDDCPICGQELKPKKYKSSDL